MSCDPFIVGCTRFMPTKKIELLLCRVRSYSLNRDLNAVEGIGRRMRANDDE